MTEDWPQDVIVRLPSCSANQMLSPLGSYVKARPLDGMGALRQMHSAPVSQDISSRTIPTYRPSLASGPSQIKPSTTW